jgi:FPC/CPF motif-containing protein YcgG
LLTTERPERCGSNPFASALARDNGAYFGFQEGRMVRVFDPALPPTPLEEQVHGELRARMLAPEFSCVGARAAFNSGAYRLGVYGDMADSGALAGLARDLATFAGEQPALGSDFSTFVAAFSGPPAQDEAEFEARLWATLQTLYDVDRLFHPPDPKLADDPEAGNFGFSFGGRGFFVIGLHPASSRLARRFPWPALVFNAHAQFDRLKADGRYPKMQAAIRARELAWQGSLNPNLSDFGERSEARQYSGRAVEEDWRCPFHVHAVSAKEE